MSSAAIQAFTQKFSESPELRHQISQVTSVPELMTLLQEWGFTLTPPEVISLAQAAYDTWIKSLKPTVRPFFVEAHDNKTLNQAIETCKRSEEVITLAQSHGFQLSESELKEAANVAYKIDGFSFEKLWFQSLGI